MWLRRSGERPFPRRPAPQSTPPPRSTGLGTEDPCTDRISDRPWQRRTDWSSRTLSQCAKSGQRLGATSVESGLLNQAGAIENKTGIQKSTLLTPNSLDQANKLSQGSSLPECGTCGESRDPGLGKGTPWNTRQATVATVVGASIWKHGGPSRVRAFRPDSPMPTTGFARNCEWLLRVSRLLNRARESIAPGHQRD